MDITATKTDRTILVQPHTPRGAAWVDTYIPQHPASIGEPIVTDLSDWFLTIAPRLQDSGLSFALEGLH